MKVEDVLYLIAGVNLFVLFIYLGGLASRQFYAKIATRLREFREYEEKWEAGRRLGLWDDITVPPMSQQERRDLERRAGRPFLRESQAIEYRRRNPQDS